MHLILSIKQKLLFHWSFPYNLVCEGFLFWMAFPLMCRVVLNTMEKVILRSLEIQICSEKFTPFGKNFGSVTIK